MHKETRRAGESRRALNFSHSHPIAPEYSWQEIAFAPIGVASS